MATAIINNLYPPIMDTYMPAFDREKECKIYFSLSSFNDREDINDFAQVQVRYQQNNKSALKTSMYPADIALALIQYDKNKKQYYISLKKTSLKNDKFELNVYYKVQIRFMTSDVIVPKKVNNFDDAIQQKYAWFNDVNNSKNFSEWSKICLIRGIATPIFSFNSFNASTNSNNSEITVINNINFASLVGNMTFTNLEKGEKESDRLKSYEIYIYKTNDLETVIYDSGIQFPQAINSINEKIKYQFEDETYYKIKIEYLTAERYSGKIFLDFYVYNQYKENDKIIDECKILCQLDNEEGRMKISLTNLDKFIALTFNGDLVFRRSSQESNFQLWEDIQLVKNSFLHKLVAHNVSTFVWYDYTIESGQLYQYEVQKIIYDENGNEKRRGFAKKNESYKLQVDLENGFLTTYDNQLKIKFNPQVSNFSKTVVENKVDTIGSKYPYFYRNAQVGYKTFSLSGTIHSLIDENYIFLNKNNYKMFYEDSLLQSNSYFEHNNNEEKKISDSTKTIIEENVDLDRKYLYGDYYEDFQIAAGGEFDIYRDYNYERRFREKVLEFLTDGKPKLFRSATEGNILVRLMNINFSPNQTLGRLIYDFSATAYEINECNLDNYMTYNIHKLIYDNTYYKAYTYSDNDLKKVGEVIFNTNNITDIYNIIKEKCIFRKAFIENKQEVLYEYSLKQIDWIDISFPTTEPYAESGVDESSLLYTNENNNRLSFEENIDGSSFPYIGYVVNINGNDIFIPQYRSYYITKEELDGGFSSISVPEDKDMSNKNIKILYKATLNRVAVSDFSIREKIRQMYLKVGVGQLWGALESDTEIISKILSLYKKETRTSFANIIKVKKLYLEGTPGAYFYKIRANGNKEYYELNGTGQLELNYGEESLSNFTFCGFKLYKAKSPIQMHEQEYYIPNLRTFDSIKEISNPRNNYVYNVAGIKKIYYLGHWCNFEELNENEGLAKYKDEVIIYYLYNLQKGEV
mgnify:CR=1 FL=1